jgi:hypothetical protein
MTRMKRAMRDWVNECLGRAKQIALQRKTSVQHHLDGLFSQAMTAGSGIATPQRRHRSRRAF